MFQRTLIAVFLFFIATSLASATGNIVCQSDDGLVVDIQVSNLAVLAVSGVEIRVQNRLLSTKMDRGEPIEVLQHFIGDDRILIDVTDDNFERVVASIRLLIAIQGNEQIIAGPVSIDGIGMFAVSCEGP